MVRSRQIPKGTPNTLDRLNLFFTYQPVSSRDP